MKKLHSNNAYSTFCRHRCTKRTPAYAPTRHELLQLVKYWARVHWHNYWVMYVCQQWGSSETRQAEFARERVDAFKNILGDADVARMVEEVKAEMRKEEEDDTRLWDAFVKGKDAPEWYVNELVEKALESERNYRRSEASQAFIDRRDVPF